MVRKRTRVAVYGSSLQLAGTEAGLKAEPALEVVGVDLRGTGAWQSLKELNPTALVFDLAAPPSGVDVTLLREMPCLLLIGVDAASDEMVVLSGARQAVRSVSDLIVVIRKEAAATGEDKAQAKAGVKHANNGTGGESRTW